MAENTKIEWADHTFSPWLGCTRVSPACEHCYAESWAKRSGLVGWGPKALRRLTSDANWRQPLKWDAAAKAAGRTARVFCASLADVFDDHESIKPEWRGRLWRLIASTPHLEWLLLTKRPENWAFMLPVAEPRPPFRNIRLGVTIEDQRRFEERGIVLQFAADIGWPTFVSYEPALGPIDWTPAFEGRAIGWLISGGESGPHARPSHPDWFRAVRDLCAEHRVPYLHKQWGEWAPGENAEFAATRTERTAEWDGDRWHFGALTPRQSEDLHRDDEPDVYRLGKGRAGRRLDGREHNDMPELAR